MKPYGKVEYIIVHTHENRHQRRKHFHNARQYHRHIMDEDTANRVKPVLEKAGNKPYRREQDVAPTDAGDDKD